MYRIIGCDGQQYGPVAAEQIRQWFAERRVNGQSLAQTEGSVDWKPLASFPEFANDTKAPPPVMTPPAPASPIAARASAKIPAGLFGILLGCLGIHKFLLGYTRPGLIMLLVTILTCGLAALPLYLIGLIEGIIYLTKTDEEFVRIYVDGRREWF
jgi:TM2 domain-containing membrane protein YozV